jgi:hypothetical protein
MCPRWVPDTKIDWQTDDRNSTSSQLVSWMNKTITLTGFKVKAKNLPYDRRSVSQSVLASGNQLGPMTTFRSLWHFFRQLRVCWCAEPSLTRRWIYNLQLLRLARAFLLVSVFRGIHDHKLFCQVWDSPRWRARLLYLFHPGTGWYSYTSRQLFFSNLFTSYYIIYVYLCAYNIYAVQFSARLDTADYAPSKVVPATKAF